MPDAKKKSAFQLALVVVVALVGCVVGCGKTIYPYPYMAEHEREFKRAVTLESKAAAYKSLIAHHEKETGDHYSLLGFVIDGGDTNLFWYLLRAGADVNEVDYRGRCPINSAVLRNDVTLVRALLNAGARMDVPRVNPLKTACGRDSAEGNLEVVKLLVEHGARLDAPKGETPPLVATHDPKIMRYLIEKGADPSPVRWRLAEAGLVITNGQVIAVSSNTVAIDGK